MSSGFAKIERRGLLLSWMGARPSRWLIVSMVFYWANYFLGPYEYVSSGSVAAWLYLGLVFGLFWLGLVVGERVINLPCTIRYGGNRLGEEYERYLVGVMVFFALASIYNYISFIEISGGGFGPQSGDARNALDEFATLGYERPTLARVADGMATSSLAFPLLVLSCRTRYSLTVFLAIFSPVMMAITQLFSGSRNGAALVVVIFAISFILRRMSGLQESLTMRRFQKALLIFGIFAFCTMILMFAWRSGHDTSSSLDVTSPFVWNGTANLREFYSYLNEACGGCFSSLYMLSYYTGHSASFFVSLFDASDYTNPHYGFFHFRIFNLVFGRGSSDFLEIVHSQPFCGLYPTAIQGLLLDFGELMTPLIVLLLGVFMGVLANAAIRGGPVAACYLPLVLTSVVISPIYYFIWGGLDFVVLGLTLLLFGLFVLRYVLRARVFRRILV